MSKGVIGSYISNGQYNVTILADDGKSYAVSAYCADLTEDLSGNVGMIEIAGDRAKGVNIQPGYVASGTSPAVYDAERDGMLYNVPMELGSQHSAGVYFNWAMRDGWQKWRPNYRYGTITVIDYDAHTCSVTLEECLSTDNSLDVNQSSSLSAVPIEYMSCNSAAFAVGDEVIVKFENFDWGSPKVIGFKEEPNGCGFYILLRLGSMCTVITREGNVATNVKLNSGGIATFPCSQNSISNWIEKKEEIANDDLFEELVENGIVPEYSEEITSSVSHPPCPFGQKVCTWSGNGTITGSGSHETIFGWQTSRLRNLTNAYTEQWCWEGCEGDTAEFKSFSEEEERSRDISIGFTLNPLNDDGFTKIGFWTRTTDAANKDTSYYDDMYYFDKDPPLLQNRSYSRTTTIIRDCGIEPNYTANGYFSCRKVKTGSKSGSCTDCNATGLRNSLVISGEDPDIDLKCCDLNWFYLSGVYVYPWSIRYNAFYNEDESIIAQFFVNKMIEDEDEDPEYQAYVSIGDDCTVDPYTVPQNDAATEALLALVQASPDGTLYAQCLR